MPVLKNLRKNAGVSPELLTLDNSEGWTLGDGSGRLTTAMKISAVNRCIEVRSDAMAVLPIFILDRNTRQRLDKHPLYELLNVRPNEAMSPFDYKKLVEVNRLSHKGGAYVWINRNRHGEPVELIPLPSNTTRARIEYGTGRLTYETFLPWLGRGFRLDPEDVLHYKGLTLDGINSVSVLERAKTSVETAGNQEQYERSFYANGGRPSGILRTDSDLMGPVKAGKYKGKTRKEAMRAEWEAIHGGSNQFRTAILDLGLDYKPIAMSNSDAQFVASKELTLADIARFYGVPLHKLYTGKQSYNSNEANGVDFVVDTLTPAVSMYEDEDTYKLLLPSNRAAGLEIRRNVMAYLRGDSASRITWYKGMRESGAFSVNDIRALEDMPDVDGGDTRYASLNYVPLELFAELSVLRAKNTQGDDAGGDKK